MGTLRHHIKIIIFCLLLGSIQNSSAQNLRLNGYGSYVLEGAYHIYYANGDSYQGQINQGMQWGMGLEYMVDPKYGIEFSAFTRNTSVMRHDVSGNNGGHAKLRFNYMLLGVNVYPDVHARKFQSFAGISTGAVVQDAEKISGTGNTINSSVVKFAWAARLGGIYWLSHRVGIKAITQWLSAIQFSKGVVNFNVNRSDLMPADHSVANQFEIGSGVIVKLGQKKKQEQAYIAQLLDRP
ncbi:MAG: hypothetical protein ACJ75B_06230 [Flavisolibacter sp.]